MTWVFFVLVAIVGIGAQAAFDGHPWIGSGLVLLGCTILWLDWLDRRDGTLTSKGHDGDGEA